MLPNYKKRYYNYEVLIDYDLNIYFTYKNYAKCYFIDISNDVHDTLQIVEEFLLSNCNKSYTSDSGEVVFDFDEYSIYVDLKVYKIYSSHFVYYSGNNVIEYVKTHSSNLFNIKLAQTDF
jgi:hypothetical protein